MAQKKKAIIMEDLQETEANINNIQKAEQKRNDIAITASIRKDEHRKIYKNIKVTREVERKIVRIKEARESRVGKGCTFDSIVYEAILEFLDKHYEQEVAD